MANFRKFFLLSALISILTLMSCDNLGTTVKNLPGALDWAKAWGGTNNDLCKEIKVDNDFNVYVVGTFKGNIDFDPSHGNDKQSSTGTTSDVFLVKFNSVGDYGWTKTWNCNTIEDVEVDSNHNIYVCGQFDGTVDMHPGALDIDFHTSLGGDDCYLIKFDSAGNYQWAKTWGGANHDFAYGIAIDTNDNIFVTGGFQDVADFDTGTGIKLKLSLGFTDCFVTKFDSAGTWYWAKTWGGTGTDYGYCGISDSNDNIYIGGVFQNVVDFNTDPGIAIRQSEGDNDCFLSKFNFTGAYVSSKTWGGTGEDKVHDLAVDSANNIFVAGAFADTVDFDPGSSNVSETSNGWHDCFLSKFSSSGNFEFVNAFGGTGTDFAMGVIVDGGNKIYVGGSFKQTVNFNPNGLNRDFTSAGGSDCFMLTVDNNGNYLENATWGGAMDDTVVGVGMTVNNEPFVAGYFNGQIDFDTTATTEFVDSNGGSDCFLAKFK